MANKDLIDEVVESAPNRRKMMKTLGLATVFAGAMSVVGDRKLSAAGSLTAADILNFALNLEYLEAEFYTYATTGGGIANQGIGTDGTGTPGPTMGGQMVNMSNNLVFTNAIAKEIAKDEQDHVKFLRTALGSAAVAKPEIDLNALGIGFANEASFLTLARIFEDVGVTAYAYAAGVPALANSPYIGAAARILAVEAEHAGNIRLQVARLSVNTPNLDGADIQPPPQPGGLYLSVYETGPHAGLVATRTPGEVLYLVYGKANASAGGFFPNGVNGTITMSSTKATGSAT